MKQTNHQKGYRRDRAVLDTIAEWGTMDTEQLRLMFFPSARVAQRRLQILTGRGKLKRAREATEQPYAYFTKRYDQTILALNWARLWLLKRLKSWEVLESFDYCGYAIIRNTVSPKTRSIVVMYNAMRKTWPGDDCLVVYDTEEQRREAAKRIHGELVTIDEIREGLKCRV